MKYITPIDTPIVDMVEISKRECFNRSHEFCLYLFFNSNLMIFIEIQISLMVANPKRVHFATNKNSNPEVLYVYRKSGW